MPGGKAAFERKLEALAALRGAGAEQTLAPLRKALKDRSNYVVKKAAELAGELPHSRSSRRLRPLHDRPHQIRPEMLG